MITRRDRDKEGRELLGSDQNPNHWLINRIRWTGDGGVILRYQAARKVDTGAQYILELSADELQLLLASRSAVA